MLQQTQAERVRPHYERFLMRFPTPASLAREPVGAAIEAWAGLGYNRRAVSLHRAAVEIVERFGGRVPSRVEDLRSLPGVGPYTASAVACFAFGSAETVVDTNVRRVLTRHRLGVEPRDSRDADVAKEAAGLAPAGSASDWGQALMDLGREVCVSRPRCEICPMASSCAYLALGRAPSRAPNGRSQAAFAGSTRQARGRIVNLLRERGSVRVASAAQAAGRDLPDTVDIVRAL
ncbi:MAG: A/G-specific adenine glycosylase, partial [Actinobacteria bacterium]|nr:A/G-specific adenine glycosylase [Actinomycetota bacterium]